MGTITEQPAEQVDQAVEHVDVLIVGAGMSGVGVAHYLQKENPGKSYAILEGRGALGGTWDLFRYPGIRSDSDLHTFGFAFKPWNSETVIAPGEEIRDYIKETADQFNITEHVRFHHWVSDVSYDSSTTTWTVRGERRDTGEPFTITSNWVFCATGYYRYDEGYTPDFPGIENFQGQVIHPQHWPEDLDYTGKRVVVIGSGATAVTLIPAMADRTEHITMLQRSPSYIMSIPSKDPIWGLLRRYVGAERSFDLVRRKNLFIQNLIYRLCRRHPKRMRRLLIRLVAKSLPEGYPVETHFNPKYDPWDQRLCFVPDGDLFKTIREGKASIATGTIDTFTENGVRLASGEEIEADIVITATGLNLLMFGGVNISVDGEPVNLSERVTFRGMMLSGIPNLAYLVGYTNRSWTLKVDLVASHFCKLLSHMDEHGYDQVVPELPYPGMTTRPLLDFQPGYVLRSLHTLVRQGPYDPWQQSMDYEGDRRNLKEGQVEDRNLHFSRVPGSDATDRVASDLKVAA